MHYSSVKMIRCVKTIHRLSLILHSHSDPCIRRKPPEQSTLEWLFNVVDVKGELATNLSNNLTLICSIRRNLTAERDMVAVAKLPKVEERDSRRDRDSVFQKIDL